MDTRRSKTTTSNTTTSDTTTNDITANDTITNTRDDLPARARSISGNGVVADEEHSGLGYEEYAEEYSEEHKPPLKSGEVRRTPRHTTQTDSTRGQEDENNTPILEPLRHIGSGDRPHEPTLGELVSGLSNDMTMLVRKEMELAVAEIQENAKEAAQAGATITVAGFLGYAGLILLLIAASLLLATVLDSVWMAMGIVGLVVIVIAAVLYGSGKAKLEDVNLLPRRAMRSVERDIDMAKEKLS